MFKFRYLPGYFILVNLMPLAIQLYISTYSRFWVGRMNEILFLVLREDGLYVKMDLMDFCSERKAFTTTLKWNLSHPM